jgi:hypothetical protein
MGMLKISYVYRLTCFHPRAALGPKYYYGVRTCRVHPSQDTRYWSSSRYVGNAIKTWGLTWFKKKIIGIYPTRQQALTKEIQLHAYFDVKNHPLFLIGPIKR